MPLKRARAWFAGVALASLLGCSASVEDQTSQERSLLVAPSRNDFPDVANAMQLRCATLDCHGQAGRNLRLYGYGGLRLSPTENPNGNPTTDPEIAADYTSVVGLEPETLSAVVSHEVDPNQLTLVRKLRGTERHKGGQPAVEGDSLDRCIVLWLTAEHDPNPCAEVINAPTPGNH